MQTELSPPHELEHMRDTAVLLFGQGPVIDKDLRERPIPGVSTQADVNIWSTDIVKAGVELYKQNLASRIIIMGGQTGGPSFPSEADLMAGKIESLYDGLQQTGREPTIVEENKSPDTIANIINMINMTDTKMQGIETYVAVSAKYHALRVGILLKLFDIPARGVYSAEDILLKSIRAKGEDMAVSDTVEAQVLIDKLDSEKSFYQHMKGTEKKTYYQRMIWDKVLTRELLERPESILSRFADIENDEKLRRVLMNADHLYDSVLRKYGISLRTDTNDQLREKLRGIPKQELTEKEIRQWSEEVSHGYPQDVQRRLRLLQREGDLVSTFSFRVINNST